MDEVSSDSSSPHPSSSAQTKRRRLHGACDTCRRKKGDSAKMPGNFCSNCKAANIECTHNIPRQSRKDTQKRKCYIPYVTAHLKPHLQIRPDGELGPLTASSPESVGGTRSNSIPPVSPPNVLSNVKYPVPQSITKKSSPTNSPPRSNSSDSDSEDLAHVDLQEHFKRMSFDHMEDRFFGRSSAFMFARYATNLKTRQTGKDPAIRRYYGRPQYWEVRPWEQSFVEEQKFLFMYPEKDLLENLVDIYFTDFHPITPVLHRPTFIKSLANGLHLRNAGFGMTVLMVCAIASRQCEDSRVWLEEDETELSAGWKFFRQVPLVRNSLIQRATIYDVQYYCLAVHYLHGTSFPHLAWNILGIGIRVAQERGVHRRKGPGYKPTLEDELWKRAFWCLLMLDRFMCSFLGRPMSIQEEDMITAFSYHLRLCEMFSFALRTLYSTKRSKMLTGFVGSQWEQRVVTELDSAMNRWKDTLPDHLRWNPNNPNATFYHQSLVLHTSFYYLQIQVHRPFLLKASSLSYPSLAFCTNAARSCSHVLEGGIERGILPSPIIFMSAFASGLVLLLNIWGGKHTGIGRDPAKEMEDVHRCMHVLKLCERRWHIPARLWDILNELSSIRDGSFPAPPSHTNNKRRRGSSGERQSSQQVPIPSYSSVMPLTESQPTHTSLTTESATSCKADTDPSSATSVAKDNWEFNELFLSQMGLPMVPFPSLNSSTAAQYGISQYSGVQPSAVPSDYNVTAFNPPTTAPMMNTSDTMSLWEGAPHGFNYEEWDSFIANMGDMSRFMGSASPDM
ncbi:fungal-specific transcription factor domain-containing protein [Cyathus striatus]|nr:fungal-specific transcription factor domain-containing protein [Cyathus striatus]